MEEATLTPKEESRIEIILEGLKIADLPYITKADILQALSQKISKQKLEILKRYYDIREKKLIRIN